MTAPLTTRAELDQLVCPDCDGDGTEGIYLACDEHPAVLSLAFYVQGELRLECAECGKTFISIPGGRLMSPTKLCSLPSCPNPARPGSSRCDEHASEYERERSARRREATKGVYKRKLWEMRRRQVLFEQPICAICSERLSEEVDHILPLSEGGARYERDNLRGLCKRCHRERHRNGAA